MKKQNYFLRALLKLFALVAITLAGGFIFGMLGIDPLAPGGGIFYLAMTQLIIVIGAYLLINNEKKKSGEDYILMKGFLSDSWKMIILGIGMAGFGNFLITFLVSLMPDSPLVAQSTEMVGNATAANNLVQQIIVTFLLVIVAPIAEEYLFRGYFFKETHKTFNVGLAIFLNGLIFGLYHMNLLQGINTLFLGMVLATVYYYRRNITDAITVHLANNAVAVLPSFIPQFVVIIGWINIICIFLGAYFLYKTIKEGKKEQGNN